VLVSRSDVEKQARELVRQVVRAVDEIVQMRQALAPAELFLALRFEPRFPHGEETRRTNLQELLNQASTSLVQLAGCSIIFDRHPGPADLDLAWQESVGWDIRCEARDVVAECYAARNRTSNNKHRDDLEKLLGATAKHRYLFYYSVEGEKLDRVEDGVRILWIDLPAFLGRIAA